MHNSIQVKSLKKKLKKHTTTFTTFSPTILIPSLIIILGLSLLSIVMPEKTLSLLSKVKQWIFDDMSWFYVLCIGIFFLFLVFVAASKYGKIKLGRNDSVPEYSFFSWISMLFAAGMGIGLMFFGVAEPLSHFSDPAIHSSGNLEAIKEAQMLTFFHWGIHGWAVYAIVGLALAYFSYRFKLPLSMRSALYPILKKRIYGKWGDVVDIFAFCGTFFGLTASLGYGVVQINAGFESVGVLSETSFKVQAIIVSVVMLLAIVSAVSGVSKGVKLLSQTNVIIAILLMLFVLFAGPTAKILGSFSEGLGNYIANFFDLTFNTRIYEPAYREWFNSWTIFYWAWWISWSPYVGLFIAKISKGRTIREYVIAVLLVPSLFVFLWMTIFGNTALFIDTNIVHGALSDLVHRPEILLFKFLDTLPLSAIMSVLAIMILSIFFVTSADSGIYVMNSIASKDRKNSPQWQKVFIGILMAVLSLSLLRLGGLGTLRTMTIISSLPFAFIILLYIYNMLSGLSLDSKYFDTDFSHSTNNWSGRHWKENLDRVLTFGKKKDVKVFIENTVRPAFKELKDELIKQDVDAFITESVAPKVGISIRIPFQNMKDFTYSVRAHAQEVSDMVIEDDNTPDLDSEKYYIPFTYFEDGRLGYDIQYFFKDEIISDVLKQYERYMCIASDQENHLIVSEKS
jgi:choline/glycine/proline betaine transport protein